MAKPLSNQPSEQSTFRKAPVSDEELLERVRTSEWRDDLLDDLGDGEEIMRRLFEVALQSLKRTNATARQALQESVAFRREFDALLAKMKQSQSETRSMIEDLVSGR